MFSGVTEASDPRLLALTGFLASSTREQAAFRSRPRGELGDIIREMLLMVTGLFMEVDARDHTLQESVDHRVEEARLEENPSATSDARSNLAVAREHSKSLQAELAYALDALKRADEKAAEAEIRCKEALKQLSSLEAVQRERDEVRRERDEVRHQYEALKADSEAAQFQHEVVMAQREEVLTRVVVLEQELVKHAESFKDLTLEAETTKLQNQHLSQKIEALKKRCSVLLEDAKLAEDRVQLECEERLWEFKESAELKKEIEQACDVRLQAYRDSPKLKAEIAEACQARLAKYKAFDELKTAIWQKGFRMFASGFNRGLREARQAPSTPLSELRAKEEDSDGEEVLYREDDLPLPKGTSRTSAGPSDKDIGLGEK
ncbi:ribosome-binding protein 1-like [Manihot esculenta]|uniref:ribosome-binding protein 1-like n=1 Tax=Manihot esculenta TaxID=3983 RepID=UPI000B5D90D3|nr:ribosome-binding protein 1-like [Manihot esculenta]